MSQKRIGDLLVEGGVLTREQLDHALARLAHEGGEARVASELLRVGLAHERQVAEALSSSAGHPAIVLSESTIDLMPLAYVPLHVAEQHVLLPIALDESTVTVAVADVDSRPIFEQVSFACARRVVRLLCIEQLLVEAIRDAYARFAGGERFLPGAKSALADAHLAVVRTPVKADADDGRHLVTQLSTHLAATPLEQLRAFAGAAAVPSTPPPQSMPLAPATPLAQAPAPAPPLALPPPPPVPVMAAPPSSPPAVIEREGDGPVVFVVEDDAGIRTLLQRAFAHDGYEVQAAESGDEAMTLLRALKPDLVVLDAMLPGVHGFELCTRIKTAPGYGDVPVLMVSAVYTGWERAREILEDHRADAFVEKPFDVHYVRKLASELLGRPLERREPRGDIVEKTRALRAQLEANKNNGHWRYALDDIHKWLALDPFDPVAHLEKGNALSQQNDLEGAMRAYEAACVYDSRSFSGRTNLALVYERLGFARKASEAWLRALDAAPDAQARDMICQRLNR